MEEKFVPIKGYEELYEISNLGRVKQAGMHGKIMKLQLKSTGYVNIKLCRPKNHKYYRVHRLVAENFIDNPENKPHVNHIDGNKENNSVNNLEWVTPLENIRHAHANGYYENIIGEKQWGAKLNEGKVREMRKRKEQGESAESLSQYFNVNQTHVYSICNRKKWKWVV